MSSEGQPYTAIAMVPPHLVQKWAREAFLTIPGIRVFLIDDMRNSGDAKVPHGINEVRLKGGNIIREGLQTSLSDLRLRKQYASSRKRWLSLCHRPALFIVGRERAKLGYFWRHEHGPGCHFWSATRSTAQPQASARRCFRTAILVWSHALVAFQSKHSGCAKH